MVSPPVKPPDTDTNWLRITERDATATPFPDNHVYALDDASGWGKSEIDARWYDENKSRGINCSNKRQSPNRVKRWRAKKKRARKTRR